MSSIKKTKFWKQAFLSYVLILFIPLCLIVSLGCNFYFRELKKSIQSENEYTLQKTKSSLDKEFQNVDTIFYQLTLNASISPFKLTENPLASIDLKKERIR